MLQKRERPVTFDELFRKSMVGHLSIVHAKHPARMYSVPRQCICLTPCNVASDEPATKRGRHVAEDPGEEELPPELDNVGDELPLQDVICFQIAMHSPADKKSKCQFTLAPAGVLFGMDHSLLSTNKYVVIRLSMTGRSASQALLLRDRACEAAYLS